MPTTQKSDAAGDPALKQLPGSDAQRDWENMRLAFPGVPTQPDRIPADSKRLACLRARLEQRGAA